MLPAHALGISIRTTVCVLWSFYQCDIDGVFHRWMAVYVTVRSGSPTSYSTSFEYLALKSQLAVVTIIKMAQN